MHGVWEHGVRAAAASSSSLRAATACAAAAAASSWPFSSSAAFAAAAAAAASSLSLRAASARAACHFIETMEKRKATEAKPETKAKRQKSQKAANPKRKKTKKTNAAAAAENGKLYDATWADSEETLLHAAIKAHGTNAWGRVVVTVHSRAAGQCERQYKKLLNKKRWDLITRETRLDRYPAPLKGLHQNTIAKFVAHGVTTMGLLADIPMNSRSWLSHKVDGAYARKLMKSDDVTGAVKVATKWRAAAIAALNKN